MPTVLRDQGFRLFFYSRENDEPAHIEHGDRLAKFWLEPVDLASSKRFRTHELNEAARAKTPRVSSRGMQ